MYIAHHKPHQQSQFWLRFEIKRGVHRSSVTVDNRSSVSLITMLPLFKRQYHGHGFDTCPNKDRSSDEHTASDAEMNLLCYHRTREIPSECVYLMYDLNGTMYAYHYDCLGEYGRNWKATNSKREAEKAEFDGRVQVDTDQSPSRVPDDRSSDTKAADE